MRLPRDPDQPGSEVCMLPRYSLAHQLPIPLCPCRATLLRWGQGRTACLVGVTVGRDNRGMLGRRGRVGLLAQSAQSRLFNGVSLAIR